AFTTRERLRYAFDSTLSRGTPALIAWLAVVSAALIVVIALPVWAARWAPPSDGHPVGFVEVVWMSLMRTLDSGTMGGDTGSWPFLLSMLAVTLGGIFVISTLIGVLTSGIEGRLDELRKGRSKVVESDHTVILGWSPGVFAILGELVLANESRRRASIVILADHDKVEMEDAIRERIADTKTTRIVCRTGSPIDPTDLEMVGVQTSRSVIVLAPEGEESDSQVIKAILAITNGPNRRTEPYHVVAEMHDPRNAAVARMVGKDEVELVLLGDVISRITVQTCRQSGLSIVVTELLDFGGDEIYFSPQPELTGKTFGEALFAYDDCSVIGLRPRRGGVRLNPPMDTVLGDGDQLIVIAEDDSAIRLPQRREPPAIEEAAIRTASPQPPRPERTLIMGWNSRVPTIVRELDAYVAPGSTVTIVAEAAAADGQLDPASLSHLEVVNREGDTTDRATIEGLNVGSFDHVILLCSETLPTQQADARVLVTLLHLRDLADKSGEDYSIVSEMMDLRNRALAEVTRPDDFIVSERLVSLMLSQISENKELAAVFDDLFDPEGSEIYLKPAEAYVAPGAPVSFHTVVEAARRRGEVAIGYRLLAAADDPARAYGVVVNPDKGDRVTFAAADKVIVLAES
ncbi:MAG TPA: potassium transporter TrkA, partial [Thermoanaerobaculia bacterium]|nr:potassium transporter TrkA [Thermoanaerobaculia bacterium]